jgi:metal-dependent amidase/aminoacylase/carboxypeptidase family protein
MQAYSQLEGSRDELVARRRDFCPLPELGFEERHTPALVAERVAQFACKIVRGIGKTKDAANYRALHDPGCDDSNDSILPLGLPLFTKPVEHKLSRATSG